MADSILNMIMGQLGGDGIKSISSQIGADEEQTKQGLGSAIPMILGALERNTADSGGASALKGALERDHDGSILDNITGFLGDPAKGNGSGILKHVLGDKRQDIESQMSKKTGLDLSQIGKLLELIAPLIMGALGKQQREGGIGLDQLSGFLGGQREESESSGGLMGIASSLLDSDKDGDVMDDLAGLAGNLFGKK